MTGWLRSVWPLAAAAAVLLLYHLFGYAGHFGYDDILYARHAADLLYDRFQLSDDHFAYRWGLVFPLAFCYSLFGINDHTSAAYPMLVTLFTVALLVHTFKGNAVLQASAAMLFLFNPWTLYYADKIMPDALVAAAVFGAVVAVHRQRFVAPHRPFCNALVFALALFYGALSKESIPIATPLFAFLFIADALQRVNVRFWAFAAGLLVLLCIGYLAVLHAWTGSYQSRFAAIAANSYFNPCSYDQLPFEHTLRRIGFELWLAFLRGGMLAAPLFALAGFNSLRQNRWLTMPDSRSFFTMCALLGLFSANFMTTSVAAYVPLCPDVRHYLFITPLAAAAGAFTLRDWYVDRKHTGLLLFLFAVAALVSFVNSFEHTLVYVLVGLVIASRFLLRSTRPYPLLLLMVAAALAYGPVRDALVNRRNGYADQKTLVQQHLKPLRDKTIVITDVVQKHFGEYTLAFDTSHVRFVAFRELPHTELPPDAAYLLLSNGMTRWLSGTDWEALPGFAKDEARFPVVATQGDVRLLRVELSDLAGPAIAP